MGKAPLLGRGQSFSHAVSEMDETQVKSSVTTEIMLKAVTLSIHAEMSSSILLTVVSSVHSSS